MPIFTGSSMKLIGYIRVSTQKQGQSGLGLEGQLSAINQYTTLNSGELIHLYREVESGKRNDRPELAKAIAHAKRIKGRLVIAKLDRLARRTSFVSQLTDTRVDFVACDNPNANTLTIHILAAVAQDEAERISQRTKAALAAAKARGVSLGSSRPGHWDSREDARAAGQVKATETAKAKRDAEALPIYRDALRIAKPLADEGQSLQEIADALNTEGLTTVRGAAWNRMQVSRLLSSGLAAAMLAVSAAPILTTR